MLSFFIAKRHLLSKKAHSVINMIAGVSMVAIAVPVMALVVILSFHNGLSDFIDLLYSEFDSEVRITPKEGMYFEPDEALIARIGGLPEVRAVSRTVEQNVLLTYADRQWIAVMRGVDSLYGEVIDIANRTIHGVYAVKHGSLERAVIGQGVAYGLGVNTLGTGSGVAEPLHVYAIRPGGSSVSFLPLSLYTTEKIIPGGIFALDEPTDSRYIFVPLEFAQRLLNTGEKISSLEVKLQDGVSPEQGKKSIEELSETDHFDVKTRFEQKETVYRMVKQEKWVIYLLLMFVVLIAALSLIGSVVILATDKEKDRDMLIAMGGTPKLLRRIFTWEGVLITGIGVCAGLVLGVLFALMQQAWGIVPVMGENPLMETYPARIRGTDLLFVALGVMLLGTFASFLTARGVIRRKR